MKSIEIERIQVTINSCLEKNDNEFLIAICQILNCKGWEERNAKGDIDLEFCGQHITYIMNRFEKPLKNTGLRLQMLLKNGIF